MIEHLKKFSKQLGVSFKKCSEYHWQIKGDFTVNVYPLNGTVFINGAQNGFKCYNPWDIVKYAKGEGRIKNLPKTARRKLNNHKKRMWKNNHNKRMCWVCGELIEYYEQASVEHKVPLSQGGSNLPDNLTLSHAKCNKARGASLKKSLDQT